MGSEEALRPSPTNPLLKKKKERERDTSVECIPNVTCRTMSKYGAKRQ